MRVIVTRPAEQAAAWVGLLRQRGVDAVALPLIEIRPVPDPAPLDRAWATLDRLAMVFFVSVNAVQHFFARRPPQQAWPDTVLAAAPGPGTAQALRQAGLAPGCIVEPAPDAASFDSEGVWAQLAARAWAGREVLIVRGEQGRDWLAERLRAAGAKPRFVAAYAREAARPDRDGLALLADAAQAPTYHLWLFSSSEAVRHLGAQWSPPSGARALATHPRIAAAARAAGFTEVSQTAPTADAVTGAIAALATGSPHLPGHLTGPAPGHALDDGSVQSRTP